MSPYRDAGPSRGTSGYIGQILQRAENLETLPTPRSKARTHWPVGAMILILVATITGFNIRTSLVPETDFVDPNGEATDMRFAMYVAIQNINAYREEHHELPHSIVMLGLTDDDITYTRHGTTYTLMAMEGEEMIHYTDGEDLTRFAAAAQKILAETKS